MYRQMSRQLRFSSIVSVLTLALFAVSAGSLTGSGSKAGIETPLAISAIISR
ncbi:hypothetical protein ACXYL9_04700 [Qipengyuania sp. CAU 1752]